jgi:hypothetical protein
MWAGELRGAVTAEPSEIRRQRWIVRQSRYPLQRAGFRLCDRSQSTLHRSSEDAHAAGAEVVGGLDELFAAIHDERAIARDGLADGLAGD